MKRRNGRYGTKAWMRRISKNRKYLNQAKGEQSGRAKIKEQDILWMRGCTAGMRSYCIRKYGISERHWYHIRAKQRWKHILADTLSVPWRGVSAILS